MFVLEASCFPTVPVCVCQDINRATPPPESGAIGKISVIASVQPKPPPVLDDPRVPGAVVETV